MGRGSECGGEKGDGQSGADARGELYESFPIKVRRETIGNAASTVLYLLLLRGLELPRSALRRAFTMAVTRFRGVDAETSVRAPTLSYDAPCTGDDCGWEARTKCHPATRTHAQFANTMRRSAHPSSATTPMGNDFGAC